MLLNKVPLQQIDPSDARFKIRLREPSPVLAESMAAVGLINPPILRADSSSARLVVVCGFGRLSSAVALGWNTIPSLILEASESDPRRCLLLSYHQSIGEGEWQLCEKAGFVARLKSVAGYSNQEIMEDFFPELRLPANRRTLDQMLAIDGWPESIKLKATAADLNPIPLLDLAGKSIRVVENLVSFFCTYRWSRSRQREVYTYLFDLSRIRDQDLSQVISETLALPGVVDPRIPLPQRAEKIRHWLRRQRYPHLVQAEESYRQVRHALHLPPQIILNEPANFEGSQYRIQFQFGTLVEYEEAMEYLARMAGNPRFNELFDHL